MTFHFKFSARSAAGFARLAVCLLASLIVAVAVIAQDQSDTDRETIAITYPLDQSIEVRFRGTTRLPRAKGSAKVKRTGRRGTRVELNIDNLPRPFELGGPYTTYVLWAISPEGRVDSLGEIKRSGSMFFNSKIDVTTPLQTFALIVTAEPHFLVSTPSRMVVLENLPPRDPQGAEVATVPVRYLGNASDYFAEARIPEIADQTYARTPISLLGARQAVALARFAGAGREAADELREAETRLAAAENAWQLKNTEAEVDQLARTATSLAVRAEEITESRKTARARREEIARRDAAIREVEQSNQVAGDEITTLRAAVTREQRERELAERDSANNSQQLREARAEIARLRDELQTAQAAAADARVRLARIEGEREAEQARLREQQREAATQAAFDQLRVTLERFGKVRDAENGLTLVLPETLFANARTSQLAPDAAATLEPLAALLANNPGLRVAIESHTDDRGTADALRQLTQERAEQLGSQLVSAGVDAARVRSTGVGAARPISQGRTAAARARNRRVEITLSRTATESANTSDVDAPATPNR